MLNGGLQFTQLGEFKLSKSYVLRIIKNNAFNNVFKDSKMKENRYHFGASFQMRIKITLWT